jgi:hypothetical protein
VRLLLLELGLEDWIPVPEAVEDVEAAGSLDPVGDVHEALRGLAADGLIRFWCGPWTREEEHIEVPAHEVSAVLEEPHWYSFHIDDPAEQRLYFVNIDNVAPGPG